MSLEKNPTVAQGAEIFAERQEHLYYMKLLENVRGYMRYGSCEYGFLASTGIKTC